MTTQGEFYSIYRLQSLINYGKNEKENLEKVLKYLSHNNTCNFDDWEVMTYKPRTDDKLNYIQEQSQCSCSHHIQDNRYVKNIYNGNMKIVGNICIKKYYNKEANETLSNIIFEEKGKKRCNGCNDKRAVDKKTVEDNKDQEFFYHTKCMREKFKKCYRCDKYKKYNCKCPIKSPPPYEEPIVHIEPIVHTDPIVPIAPIVKPKHDEITLDTILTFGEFKGKTFKDLLENTGYCKWILKLENPYIKQMQLIKTALNERFI